jgi:hypothetical protein
MKKIRKLIELYYEHKLDLLKRDMRVNWATEREIEVVDIEKVEEDELEKNLNKLSELKPFIKWLVENEKIDFRKLPYLWEYWMGIDIPTDSIIAILSISDTPIEDLISYLK